MVKRNKKERYVYFDIHLLYDNNSEFVMLSSSYSNVKQINCGTYRINEKELKDLTSESIYNYIISHINLFLDNDIHINNMRITSYALDIVCMPCIRIKYYKKYDNLEVVKFLVVSNIRPI